MLKAFGASIQIGGEMGRHISVTPGAKMFGQEVIVPGDISSASFFIVLTLLSKNSKLILKNINVNKTRTGIIDILKRMNAKMRGGEVIGNEKNT